MYLQVMRQGFVNLFFRLQFFFSFHWYFENCLFSKITSTLEPIEQLQFYIYICKLLSLKKKKIYKNNNNKKGWNPSLRYTEGSNLHQG